MPFHGAHKRCLSRVPEGSRCAARLWRSRCGDEHAMADNRGCEGKGQVGAEGVWALTGRLPPNSGHKSSSSLPMLVLLSVWQGYPRGRTASPQDQW
jgi:hypothetical protein